jgi:hypothetical protein
MISTIEECRIVNWILKIANCKLITEEEFLNLKFTTYNLKFPIFSRRIYEKNRDIN